jgi:hypothetical protein
MVFYRLKALIYLQIFLLLLVVAQVAQEQQAVVVLVDSELQQELQVEVLVQNLH